MCPYREWFQMSWNEVLDRLQKPLPARYAEQEGRLRTEDPALYWYPCCGSDLSPLVFCPLSFFFLEISAPSVGIGRGGLCSGSGPRVRQAA